MMLYASFSSVTQSCPSLCNPMDCSTQSFPVHHKILELAQTHVHWVVMASNHFILCRPLLLLPSIFPRIRVFSNESALCIRWPKFGASTSASVLPMNIQDLFPLGLTGWISLQSKDSQESSPHHSPQKHQFLCAQPSLRSNSHIHTWLLEKPYLWLNGPMFAK